MLTSPIFLPSDANCTQFYIISSYCIPTSSTPFNSEQGNPKNIYSYLGERFPSSSLNLSIIPFTSLILYIFISKSSNIGLPLMMVVLSKIIISIISVVNKFCKALNLREVTISSDYLFRTLISYFALK